MNPTHKALRDATAKAHDRVDAAFARFDLADRASYAAFLAAHAAALIPLEAALDAADAKGLFPDWPERKRAHLLREDLAQLPRASIVPAGQIEPGTGDAWIAGTLYVLEGSRLGGRFLARQLPIGFPRAYLDADQRAGTWQQLLKRIDYLLSDPAAFATALAAAQEAFAVFERSTGETTEKG